GGGHLGGAGGCRDPGGRARAARAWAAPSRRADRVVQHRRGMEVRRAAPAPRAARARSRRPERAGTGRRVSQRSWWGGAGEPWRRPVGQTRAGLEDIELSPIKAVELEASRIADVVSLAQGIPSFDTPERIKQFVVECLAEGACARYSVTPGLPRLREAIAESLTREGMAYDPDGEILVTAAAVEDHPQTLLPPV